jgi:hypothetical protein
VYKNNIDVVTYYCAFFRVTSSVITNWNIQATDNL